MKHSFSFSYSKNEDKKRMTTKKKEIKVSGCTVKHPFSSLDVQMNFHFVMLLPSIKCKKECLSSMERAAASICDWTEINKNHSKFFFTFFTSKFRGARLMHLEQSEDCQAYFDCQKKWKVERTLTEWPI